MPDVARLRVQIDDVKPAVVRRVDVPVTVRLDDLHFVLQIAIGWQNCHPFEFRVEASASDAAASIEDYTKTWGLVDRDDPKSGLVSAETATLTDVLVLAQTFRYDYVYGEDWSHIISVEAILPANRDTIYPCLISAEGRCPPADIGGPDGYETFLQAIADPQHLHHEGMLDWDDPDFDPHTVDEIAIRANLANLGKYLGRRRVS